jgi:quercetin dioxygenase-like cupin family protein
MWVQWLIDGRVGAQHVMSFACRLDEGANSAPHSHPADEVVYVVEGAGEVSIDGVSHRVQKGNALYIPEGAEHFFGNLAPGALRLVGAMAPPVEHSPIGRAPARLTVEQRPAAVDEKTARPTLMTESGVKPTMMGERSFRLLVNPEVGCLTMTQFTGIIPPGRAPLHAHPYEEATYVLSGVGRLWIGDEPCGDLRAGSMAFLPIGVRHTLENTTEDSLLKVLGAFSPPNSPEAKLEPHIPR